MSDSSSTDAAPRLPEIAGDTTVFVNAGGSFVITNVAADTWAVRKLHDPLYLGELHRTGESFDYDAKDGSVRIVANAQTLDSWTWHLGR